MRLNYIANIDCLEGLKEIPDGSVDLVLTDPPYGTMQNMGKSGAARAAGYADMSWDKALDPSLLFNAIRRVLRPNGKAVVFSQEPYTSQLISGAVPELPFCYRAIWKKDHFANKFMCKKAMVNYYEDVCVFQKNDDDELVHPLRGYFREVLHFIGVSSVKEINNALGHRKAEHRFYVTNGKRAVKEALGGAADHVQRIGSSQFSLCTEATYQQLVNVFHIDKMQGFREYEDLQAENSRFKSTFNLWQGGKVKPNVLEYRKDRPSLHSAQKPVALIEDLVQTYSNPGDVVLDPFMGSGTTAVACLKTGRNYIGFELDEKYHAIAMQRIAETESQLQQEAEQ